VSCVLPWIDDGPTSIIQPCRLGLQALPSTPVTREMDNWTTFIAPAVVAAVIAAMVSIIVAVINRATLRAMHGERLDLDRNLAERRASADIALAERKVALDRALEAWKRRTEFAEAVLTDFYQATEIIREARSPGGFGNEGGTRQKEDWETERDTRTLNSYFRTTERLLREREFFSQLYAKRFRFMAYFGNDAAQPYNELHRIYSEIVISVRILIDTHRNRDLGSLTNDRRRWESVIWAGTREDDPIPERLNQIVAAIETTCRPVIQEIVQ
jgi:hypothetical protein